MIRVTVELIPYGDESHPRRQILGTAKIANVGGTATLGHYRYELRGKRGQRIRSGVVSGFPRKRLLAWDLLSRALKDAGRG